MATIREYLTLAFQHCQAGRLEAAEKLCRQVLEVQPDQVDACHLLGLILYQGGQPQAAADWIGRSIAATPGIAPFHANLGLCYQALRRWADAEACFRQALRLDPRHLRAQGCLGLVLHQQGKLDESVAAFRRAAEMKPDSAEILNDLGLALKSQGKLRDAADCYWRAVQLDPNFVQAHNNLGNVLGELGMAAEAVACYRVAVERLPQFAEAHNNLGMVLKQLGKLDDAAASFRRAVELKPEFVEAQANLGAAFHEQGRLEEAAACYRRVRQLRPDSPVARHMEAACTGQHVPPRAEDQYLALTFNAVASTFDAQLAALQYGGPQQIAAAATSHVPARASLDVLDAGCGTGLCGPVLRPFARRLTGVDLSPGMLRKAEARQVYDRLVLAELTDHLQSVAEGYDLIAAADTLIYFGDLGPVLSAAAAALRPGGFLIFTVEKTAQDPAEGYLLQCSGRYAHNEKYLLSTLQAAGLHLRDLAPVVLRLERGQPVHGFVVSAEKTPATSTQPV